MTATDAPVNPHRPQHTRFEVLTGFDPRRATYAGAIAERVGRYDRESGFRGNLSLVCDQNGWAGTFYVALEALLGDLLPEGPVDALVTYAVPAEASQGRPDDIVMVAAGRLVAYRDNTLLFADGARVDAADNLLAVSL